MKCYSADNETNKKNAETYAMMIARMLIIAIEDLDTIGMQSSGVALNKVVEDIMTNYSFDTKKICFRDKLTIS